MKCLLVILAAVGTASGCGGGGGGADGGPAAAFPADYLQSYTEVRDCRQSTEHDLNHVRVLAGPDALAAYQGRDQPFPVGAVVVKEEYALDDVTCSGDIVQWTVMQRLAEGSSPDTLDWTWQQVDPDRNVVGQDLARCIGCHTDCGTTENGGYQGTCSQPP